MNRQKGLSLVELMIGIAVGIIVLGTAGSLFVSTLRSNLDAMKQQRFEESVQVLTNTIAAGVRRAGFSNSVNSLPDVTGWTPGLHYYLDGTCMLFTYIDTAISPPKQQFFGYKLDTATGIMYSYQSDALVACSTTSTWEAITDPTQIVFSEATPGTLFSSPSNPRLVEIRLIAEAKGLTTGADPVRREITVKVFIRNS